MSDRALEDWIHRYGQDRFEEGEMDDQAIYREPPILVRARFDASRHQNVNEWRLSRDLDAFEQQWDAERRAKWLRTMQKPDYRAAILSLLAVAAILLGILIGAN